MKLKSNHALESVHSANAPTAMARMARVGACSSPSVAPDGSRVAFVSDLGGVPQVWTVAAGGGWPELVTALDDPVAAVEWSPDGQWLAFSVAPGGGMNVQVYIVRPDGTDARRVTDGGRETNGLGPWFHDGRLTFRSNRREPSAIDAYTFDTDTGTVQLVAQSRGVGYVRDVSHDGRRMVLSRVQHRGDNNLFLIDLDGGDEVLLTPHEGTASFGDTRFAPDGATVYLTSNKDRDRTGFARIRLDTAGLPGAVEVLAERDDAELESFDITEDGATAALVWNVAGRNELVFLDLSTWEASDGPALPGELAGGLTYSKDGRLLALTISGSALPIDIWLYDCRSGALRQLTHSPHAGVNLGALVQPELVRFPAHDGLELSGWLYHPHSAGGPGPTVLSFHGGPEAQERPRFDRTYQALLAQGIAVFAPNVRGSSGFGKRFVNLDNGALRVDGVRDIASCVAYAVESGVAQPGRIGIMGASYGGYMTMCGLSEYPETFAAGVNTCGVVNFETFFANTEPWMAAISKVKYGDPDTETELLRALSPIHKCDRVIAPTLVIHGANDTNVPVIEAEQVVERLKERGVPVEYLLFPDEGHGVTKAANRQTSTLATVRWFVQHLGLV